MINKKSIDRVKAEERDAMMDIYNYAARFDAVPRFQIEARTEVHRGRRKSQVVVIVEFSKQGIRVEAQGSDIVAAERNAALKFKKAAERYHAKQGSGTIIIKDSGALTTSNASQFLEFYRIVHPGVTIKAESRRATERKGLKHPPHRAQISINGELVGEPVEMSIKKNAEDAASLTACIALTKRAPDLHPRFLRALKSGNGQILRPITPVDMPVDEDCSLVMRETLLAARRAGLPDVVEELTPEADVSESRRGSIRRRLSPQEAENRDWALQRKLSDYLQNAELTDLRNMKAELPMNQYAAKVLDLVNNNVYSIIVGATGSGKSTQVPQILLEDAIAKGKGALCNIVCTQPRRIAAISVARRVAVERAEQLQDSIGYHVRFDAKPPKVGGSITFCTTGILQQQLQHFPDDILDNVSHLVIDEVHERDMMIDFTLILLKKNIMRRQALGKPIPHIVLMSATMDTELFASYFKTDVAGKGILDCPSLSVPGRTFPVKEKYLDEVLNDIGANHARTRQHLYADKDTKDYLDAEIRFRNDHPVAGFQQALDGSKNEASVIDWKRERNTLAAEGSTPETNEKENMLVPLGLVACTIAHIAKTSPHGAILAFLPGLAEITKVEAILKEQDYGLGVDFRDESRFKLCFLHSSLPAGQNTVFDSVPEGCRKIILATNIAETSITIPDVRHVVDTGKLREKQYDQGRRISQLLCTWISKSNSKQRAGRAGRVQNGNYYALFTKERYESLRAIGIPELLRVDLQEICLNVKANAFQTPVRQFLAEAIEPPDPKAVDSSIENLEALNALTDDEAITPLGRLLSSLPVHPTLGKMIVLGIIFRCLDPMLVLGAASAERALFVKPLELRQEAAQAKLSFVEGSASDHLAILNAVRELRRVRDEQGERSMWGFCQRNFLHLNAFRTIDATAQQIEEILVDARLIPSTPRFKRVKSQFGDPSLNENSYKTPLIKALALAGSYPNVAISGGGRSFRTVGEKNAVVHPSSINAPMDRRQDQDRVPRNTLYIYSTMARSNDGKTIWLRDTTEVTPLMAALFGGKLRRNNERGNIIELDGWLPFYISSTDRRAVKTVVEFRKALERLLTGAFRDLDTRMRRIGNGRLHQQPFLADETVRASFATGLADVLDRDVKVGQAVATRGWGAGHRYWN